ncbi:transcription elongation factor GreA [Patescibacteria group bacterium]
MNTENYITQVGLEKLKLELEDLKTNKRKELAKRIEQAKEFGDISENAEYDTAKEEQAFVEGRIAELSYILKNATIIKENASNGMVGVGSKIRIKDKDNVKEYKIVGREEADPSQGLISNESPMGKAFLGKKVGDIVEIEVPKGIIKLEVVDIV